MIENQHRPPPFALLALHDMSLEVPSPSCRPPW